MTISPSRARGFPHPAWEGNLVRICESRLVEAAARLVTAGEGPDFVAGERFLAYAAENAIPLEVMWGALDARDGVAATCLGVPSPGRTAMVFATRATSVARGPAIASVIGRVCDDLAARGVRLAQALLEPRERAERGLFEQAGFSTLATLAYLQCSIPPRKEPPEESWPEDVATERYSSGARGDFIRALEASYEDTRDCPALSGIRKPDDVLAGHQATGAFDPALWTLLRVAGTPSGVLLLNPVPRQGAVELVYLGLSPSARGRGLGGRLLRHGLRQVGRRPERAVSLAVDEGNVPAVRMYSRHGFRRILRRTALIRALDQES